MEGGFYRCNDQTVSMDEWFRLNFDAVRQEVINRVCASVESDADCSLEFVTRIGVEEPEEPEEDDFDSEEEFETAHEKWEDEHEEWEQETCGGLPMWSTMWMVEQNSHIVEALTGVGLVVFEVSGPMEDFATNDFFLFGADSAGHSFAGSYWIPLRARLAQVQLERGNISDEDYRGLIAWLAPQMRAEGESEAHFTKRFAPSVSEEVA